MQVSSRLKSVIGSELQSIYDNHTTSSPFFVISGDSVMIDVIVNEGYYNYILNLLQTNDYGLTDIISNGANNLIITGKYPIVNLPKLNLQHSPSFVGTPDRKILEHMHVLKVTVWVHYMPANT